MKILFLDDDRDRHDAIDDWWKPNGWDITHVRTVTQLARSLQDGPWDLICLDHDLGTPLDGRDAVRVLVERGERSPVWIHSYNALRAYDMERMLREAGWSPVYRGPFGPMSANDVRADVMKAS
jgi:DNA-binding response OmpR family regulator